MHEIDISKKNLYTDLVLEKKLDTTNDKIINKNNNIKVVRSTIKNNNYTTIFYNDITDKDNFNKVQKVFVNELKKYLNLKAEDIILVVGLGNDKSTPDSLGPEVINNILVTRYLFLLGDVEEGYSNVASFTPNVTGNTGIETSRIIKSIIKESNATKVIIVDSLKTNNISRLGKTIQITNKGISPGSGVNNNREEISKKTMNTDIIAIGIPTVVDIKNIIENISKLEFTTKENLIVTPTNIDFLIEKLSLLIGNGINLTLHRNFIRQNNI